MCIHKRFQSTLFDNGLLKQNQITLPISFPILHFRAERYQLETVAVHIQTTTNKQNLPPNYIISSKHISMCKTKQNKQHETEKEEEKVHESPQFSLIKKTNKTQIKLYMS